MQLEFFVCGNFYRAYGIGCFRFIAWDAKARGRYFVIPAGSRSGRRRYRSAPIAGNTMERAVAAKTAREGRWRDYGFVLIMKNTACWPGCCICINTRAWRITGVNWEK
jgi:hypothetical protein